jgi:predicted GIY-YIG superfamily endonuclease
MCYVGIPQYPERREHERKEKSKSKMFSRFSVLKIDDDSDEERRRAKKAGAKENAAKKTTTQKKKTTEKARANGEVSHLCKFISYLSH